MFSLACEAGPSFVFSRSSLYHRLGRRGADPLRGTNEEDGIAHLDGACMVVTNQTPPNARDMIGRDAAGYIIDNLIGEGGMGAVYSAYSPLLGKRAAIKVMLAEYTDNHAIVERFSREAKAAAAVKDLNIIDVYAASRFPEDGRMYIVMPYIEGGSLEQLCRDHGQLPLDVTVAIMLQVCSGLDAVHAIAIVHRDIKTQNILIAAHHGRKYCAYIVDFGIVKLLDPHLAGSKRLTATRAVVGTVGSMAPEQARGDADVDARADVYSVGMVLYRMLTGRTPYEGETMYAIWENQAKGAAFPRPRALRPDIPPAIEELILQCLEHDRKLRPSSMREVAQRLAKGVPNGDMMMRVLAPRLCTDVPLGPSEATLAGNVEASFARWTMDTLRPRRTRAVWIAAAFLASGLLGAGAILLFAKKHHTPPAEIVESGSAVAPTQVASTTPVDARELTVAHDASPPPDAAVIAMAPVDAGALPDAAPIHHNPPIGTVPVPHSDHPQPHDTGSPIATTGTLIVKVTPSHAEVYIDDNYAGTSPVRKLLSTGKHHVKLTGNDKQEEVDVTINPAKDTTLSRNW